MIITSPEGEKVIGGSGEVVGAEVEGLTEATAVGVEAGDLTKAAVIIGVIKLLEPRVLTEGTVGLATALPFWEAMRWG